MANKSVTVTLPYTDWQSILTAVFLRACDTSTDGIDPENVELVRGMKMELYERLQKQVKR